MSDAEISAGFLRLVNKCNSFLLPGSSRSTCVPFYIEDKQVGLIRPDILAEIKHYPDVFIFTSSPEAVHLSQNLKTFKERTEVLATTLESLRKKDVLVSLRGWRDERFTIFTRFGQEKLLAMERSATCLFGLHQHGVHLNGYTIKENNEMFMWIGQRSLTKATYPGMWDNMCAGGLSAGLGLKECMIKESQEEASVADVYLKKLKSVGSVSYYFEDERGLFPECQFVFDLELPQDFCPVGSDGEMRGFQLVSMNQVKDLIIADDFKLNCALVILDFMIRHGIISPDKEPNYALLVQKMHHPLQEMYDSR